MSLESTLSVITMNHNRTSPMLGDFSGMREDAAALFIPELNGSDDLLGNTTHAPYGSEPPESDPLAEMDLFNISSISMLKPMEGLQFVELPQPQVRRESSSSLEDVERLINREMNTGVKHYEFLILENDKTRSTTHEMVENLLFAMPNKDIPIKVVGAQGGHVVKVGLRYTTGVHHNTPVRACKTHNDSDDPGFSFHIPKLHGIKTEDQGHLTVEIPVPYKGCSEASFSFSLVFRCLNSCHRDYGKDQEMILKLCDLQDNVLKETRIQLRVCKNVNRDKKQDGQGLGQRKKRSGSKTKGPTLKKVKQEVEEGSEGMQAAEGGTLAPSPFLFHCQGGRIRVQVELDPALLSTFKEFVKVLRGRVLQIEGEEQVDGVSSDPLSNA